MNNLPEIKEVKLNDYAPKPLKTTAAMDKVAIHAALLSELEVSREEFIWCVNAAWMLFCRIERMPTPDEAIEAFDGTEGPWFGPSGQRPKDSLIRSVWNDKHFHSVCYYRGIRGRGAGLDERMLICLQEVTNIASRATLETRLTRAGIKLWEFQAWLNYKPFRDELNHLSDKMMNNASSLVDVALTSQAVNGNLESIKYWDQRTGKFDPNKQTQIDVKQFLEGVVRILQECITDPELLLEIGGKLAVLTGAAGVTK